ncbi:ribonuclease H-like domain-containing protein [Tanacetum coccineum]|uniref:Ribonuclease H-like domain-containing protein n=1 Tax=Tanacetum coccineum TaxID=301880 RepID=A0ABQ5F1K8_9ASTR
MSHTIFTRLSNWHITEISIRRRLTVVDTAVLYCHSHRVSDNKLDAEGSQSMLSESQTYEIFTLLLTRVDDGTMWSTDTVFSLLYHIVIDIMHIKVRSGHGGTEYTFSGDAHLVNNMFVVYLRVNKGDMYLIGDVRSGLGGVYVSNGGMVTGKGGISVRIGSVCVLHVWGVRGTQVGKEWYYMGEAVVGRGGGLFDLVGVRYVGGGDIGGLDGVRDSLMRGYVGIGVLDGGGWKIHVSKGDSRSHGVGIVCELVEVVGGWYGVVVVLETEREKWHSYNDISASSRSSSLNFKSKRIALGERSAGHFRRGCGGEYVSNSRSEVRWCERIIIRRDTVLSKDKECIRCRSRVDNRELDVSDETPRVNSAVLPSIELVNPPVCNESEPFSWDDIGEEESFITYTVNERSELIPDEEPLEESLIAPLVVESSHASSDKEESLIAPPVSECTEDEGVLEDESEYTDDHNEEVEVSEDNEKEVAAAQNDKMDTPSEETPRVKNPESEVFYSSINGLVNPPVCNESEHFSRDDIGEEESFITYTVNERSELIPDEELLEESSIAPLVVESSHASSDKEESLIAPPVSESTQDEGVLDDESDYTDDHNEEVEVSEDESESSDNEKEVAAAQNDEMDTPSEETPRVKSAIPNYLRGSTGSCHDICKYGKRHEHVSEETPRVNSAILPSMELVNPPVCNESEPFSWDDIGEEESFITYTVNERSELIPHEELPENSTIMPTVIESFHAFSDKEVSEESLIALPVSESTQDEGVLEDNDKGVKLKFRRGKVLDIQSENNDSKNGRKSVVLKHRQGEQEKKNAHGFLNNIIEETASKIAESRKSKVKALVGAYKNISPRRKTLFHVIKKMVVSFTINTGLSLCGSPRRKTSCSVFDPGSRSSSYKEREFELLGHYNVSATFIVSDLSPIRSSVKIEENSRFMKYGMRRADELSMSAYSIKVSMKQGSNAGIKKKEIKTVKKAETIPKTGPAKKLIPKATLTDSRSQKASFSRAESLKATKSKSAIYMPHLL